MPTFCIVETEAPAAARVLPVSPTKGVTGPGEASVEYRLLRDAKARAARTGRIAMEDVCDAHPELLRAAKNIGRPTKDPCPVCGETTTVEVTYVFGAKLPAGGTCPGTATELRRLLRREEPVQAYTVEVCTACKFHHLLRRYPGGGDEAPSKRKRSGS
jgi:hypothetical protein